MREMDIEVQKMLDGQADRAGGGRRHAEAVGSRVRQVGGLGCRQRGIVALPSQAQPSARDRIEEGGIAWRTPSRTRPARKRRAASGA